MPTFKHNNAARCSSPGFTLLEMLIVGALTAVLMLGVWSLFRTWGKLYERGERRVLAAQLVRSLCDQFSDDARAVAYVAPPRRRGSSSRSGFSGGSQALVGGSDWLVLEVLQPPNPFMATAASDNPDDVQDSGALYAPELQRIVYTFQPPAQELDSLSAGVAELAELDDTELVGDEEALTEPFRGLLRLTLPTEQFDEITAGAATAGGSSRRSRGLSDAAWQLRELAVGASGDVDSSLSLGSSGTTLGADSEGDFVSLMTQDEVPEVIWFELRYYDGSSWASSWDSLSQGRLPVAIEMRFELKKEETEEELVTDGSETELVDDGLSESESLDDYLSLESDFSSPTDISGLGAESLEETPYYRCVVFLGAAEEEDSRN